MKILGIETSCDETALCLLQAEGDFNNAELNILSNSLLSQINLHREFGGVYPHLAKREHSINLTPMLEKVLREADLYEKAFRTQLTEKQENIVKNTLERESQLSEMLLPLLKSVQPPAIDRLAVTVGPGLEPALWTGINFAKALSNIWGIPAIPVNHMEGHTVSSLLKEKEGENKFTLKEMEQPALALLISGGHTQLVVIKDWLNYKIIGQTRDDAVGEAFDKVARMLDLPYPGGPEISRLAQQAREKGVEAEEIELPRPMINSDDLDFSFSGIKTAVMYKLKKIEELDDEMKMKMALEFENAVTEVLVHKTKKAIEKYDTKDLLVGGGVSANKHIRNSLEEAIQDKKEVSLQLPPSSLSVDNAIMIATAGYLRDSLSENAQTKIEKLTAQGNLPL